MTSSLSTGTELSARHESRIPVLGGTSLRRDRDRASATPTAGRPGQATRPGHHKREELCSGEGDVDLSPSSSADPTSCPSFTRYSTLPRSKGWGPTRTVPAGPTQVDILTARFSAPGPTGIVLVSVGASC
jgi:hypothetical protein